MEKEQWIPIKTGASEDDRSMKTVNTSGLQELMKAGVDQTRKGSTQITYELGGAWKGTLEHAQTSYDTIAIPRAATMTEEGAPAIPQEGIFVAVPNGATNIAVRVVQKEMQPLPGTWNLKPAPKPITEKEYLAGKEEYRPNAEIYQSDNEYPGKDFEFIGAKTLEGVTVAHILIYLAQYKPKSGTLSVVKTMTLEISYEVPPQVRAAPERPAVGPMLQDLILDFENVGGEKSQRGHSASQAGETPVLMRQSELEPHGNGITPHPAAATRPLTDADGTLKRTDIISDYVIIAPDALADAVSLLLQAKSGWPHYAMVATTQTIGAEFPASSLEESIKAFLMWALDNWRATLRYVVLAGDTDTIPTYIWKLDGVEYASDHYYADVKGTLAPDIVVSRIPTSDANTMNEICQRLIQYPSLRGPDWGGWVNEVVLVAYELPVYKNCCDGIATAISPRFKVTKLFGDSSTTQDVINKMNSGVLIANYRGHGLKTEWESANGLNTQDIQALKNDRLPPMVFCVCCENAWIDDNSVEVVAETFLRDGKAVALIGASRDSPTYANNDLDAYLWQSVIDYGEVTPGDIFYRAKYLMLLNHPNVLEYEQDVVMYMLFGDPTAHVASNVEFLRGVWDMDHDGWKGTLDISQIGPHKVEKSDSCGYPTWSFSGT